MFFNFALKICFLSLQKDLPNGFPQGNKKKGYLNEFSNILMGQYCIIL